MQNWDEVVIKTKAQHGMQMLAENIARNRGTIKTVHESGRVGGITLDESIITITEVRARNGKIKKEVTVTTRGEDGIIKAEKPFTLSEEDVITDIVRGNRNELEARTTTKNIKGVETNQITVEGRKVLEAIGVETTTTPAGERIVQTKNKGYMTIQKQTTQNIIKRLKEKIGKEIRTAKKQKAESKGWKDDLKVSKENIRRKIINKVERRTKKKEEKTKRKEAENKNKQLKARQKAEDTLLNQRKGIELSKTEKKALYKIEKIKEKWAKRNREAATIKKAIMKNKTEYLEWLKNYKERIRKAQEKIEDAKRTTANNIS